MYSVNYDEYLKPLQGDTMPFVGVLSIDYQFYNISIATPGLWQGNIKCKAITWEEIRIFDAFGDHFTTAS